MLNTRKTPLEPQNFKNKQFTCLFIYLFTYLFMYLFSYLSTISKTSKKTSPQSLKVCELRTLTSKSIDEIRIFSTMVAHPVRLMPALTIPLLRSNKIQNLHKIIYQRNTEEIPKKYERKCEILSPTWTANDFKNKRKPGAKEQKTPESLAQG